MFVVRCCWISGSTSIGWVRGGSRFGPRFVVVSCFLFRGVGRAVTRLTNKCYEVRILVVVFWACCRRVGVRTILLEVCLKTGGNAFSLILMVLLECNDRMLLLLLKKKKKQSLLSPPPPPEKQNCAEYLAAVVDDALRFVVSEEHRVR